MNNTRIARADKDRMRARLEEILQNQKELVKKIEIFAQETGVAEYQIFWTDLRKSHNELIRKVSNYMVRKCNR